MLTRLIIIITGIFILFPGNKEIEEDDMIEKKERSSEPITLFLCGDVMTGRGIDQVLSHSVNPKLYESYVKDSRDYVRIAEQKNGPINDPVSYEYIWGDALKMWNKKNPDFKLINLETSITTNEEPWLKGINYRMHPENIALLKTAGIDYCALANNHTLDWKEKGFQETIATIEEAGIAYSGAGKNITEARKPAILEKNNHRMLVYSIGYETSGIPDSWKAKSDKPGVNFLTGLNQKGIEQIKKQINHNEQPEDIVVLSIHWGENWGYEIPERQKKFAHEIIDETEVDIIHGHSSHHPKGVEVYNNKLIIYGAGDFINDYEGIGGHEKYRDDLTIMYFPAINPDSGDLISMTMVPMQIRKFSLNKISSKDFQWLQSVLDKHSKKLGSRVVANEDGSMSLKW